MPRHGCGDQCKINTSTIIMDVPTHATRNGFRVARKKPMMNKGASKTLNRSGLLYK